VRIQSDVLTITLRDDRGTPTASERGAVTLQEIVASGHVRIEQGERWATGGKAVFDQPKRILLLTESPVLHDGPNEVAGERVVVYLDEDRSVVEGGSRRVKAVLYPDRDDEAPAR
jgi:lipopolysaccharide export system protein LptA